MSWYIFDVNGYVGDLASNSGLVALRDEVKGKSTCVDSFFSKGSCDDLTHLLMDLQTWKPEDNNNVSTWENLLELVDKCKEIAIISDGFEDG